MQVFVNENCDQTFKMNIINYFFEKYKSFGKICYFTKFKEYIPIKAFMKLGK